MLETSPLRPPSSVIIPGQSVRLAAGRGVRFEFLNAQGTSIGSCLIAQSLDRPIYELWSFEIYPEYRHKGLGRQVMQSLLSVFKPMWLRVNKTNSKALALYTDLGFHIVSERLEDVEMEYR